MRILVTSAAILSLIAGVATTARAQTVKQFQLVGFTSGSLPADTGVLGFGASCQAEFAASRMCTSTEVMQTVDMPELSGSTTAWVRPIAQPGSNSGGVVVDASGVEGQQDYGLSCGGWSLTYPSSHGLIVDGKGRFDKITCSQTRRVACCSLLTVPEPSTSLLQGAAAATLGALAAKRSPRATSSSVEPPS